MVGMYTMPTKLVKYVAYVLRAHLSVLLNIGARAKGVGVHTLSSAAWDTQLDQLAENPPKIS